MKLDPRERPTVGDLLADEWFKEESEDTRVPLKWEEVDGNDVYSFRGCCRPIFF